MSDNSIIRNISNKAFKANQLRNIFAILGIVLTTVLFTCIFTVIGSWTTSISETQQRQVGTAAQGEFKFLSDNQYDKIKQHGAIDRIGYSTIIANVKNSELNNHRAELRAASDDWVAEITFSMPSEGRMPEEENEIAMDTIMLRLLEVPCVIGEHISITYNLGDRLITDEFVLSGYWEGDNIMPASLVWVSNKYTEKLLGEYVSESESDRTGTKNALVVFKNKKNTEKIFESVIRDCGYSFDDIKFAVNEAGSIDIKKIDKGVLATAIIVLVIIMLCGYLIISNIFSISIINDIHSYALFKVIGMTSKQLRSIVRIQVEILCVIGIPIGILVGYTVGYILTPYTFRILNISVSRISVNPLIFLITAIFSVITVFVSTHKAEKMVKQVSPITALRGTEADIGSKNKCKKQILKSGNLKLLKMAYANVFRNKKKCVNVIVSLIVSMFLLNITYSLANDFNLDAYISNYTNFDFMVADKNYFGINAHVSENGALDFEKVTDISSIDGIEQCGSIYFKELKYQDDLLIDRFRELMNDNSVENYLKRALEDCINKNEVNLHLYGIDSMFYDELAICSGDFNRQLFESGEYVLVSSFHNSENKYTYQPGDVIEIAGNGTERKEYKVLAIAELPYYLTIRHSHLVSPDFILPSKEFEKLQEDSNPMLFVMNTEKGKIDLVDKSLEHYCNKKIVIDYISRKNYQDAFNEVKQMFLIVGITLSVILGFIGILNFMNNTITSIIVRRREFALLQSIGMESKQLNVMIICEGLIYVAIAFLGVITIGYALGEVVILGLRRQMWYLSPGFTVFASAVCFPVLALIAGLVPYICIRMMRKRSIVERLSLYE